MKSNPTQHCRNLRMNNSSCSDEGTSERNVKLSINSVSRPQVRQHCQRRYFQDRRKEKQKHAKHQFSPSYTVQHIPIHIHSTKNSSNWTDFFSAWNFVGLNLLGHTSPYQTSCAEVLQSIFGLHFSLLWLCYQCRYCFLFKARLYTTLLCFQSNPIK